MNRYLKIALTVVLLISSSLFSVSKETTLPFVEMEVKGVRPDPLGQNLVVILADKEGKKGLPIWIGLLEAAAIDRELKNISPPRPMTHDLLHSILSQTQVKVKEVRIVNLEDHTYYATLFLIFNKGVIEIDARPSDAIILALKSKTPIFVSAKILDDQGIPLVKENNLGERYGIRIQELTPSLASFFDFKEQKGVLISEVVSGSLSERLGIKAGDIVTKVNLTEVGNIQEFEDAFDAVKASSSVRILLFRDGTLQEVNLSLKH